MLMHFTFVFRVMRLAPLFVTARIALLLCLPGVRRRTTLLHETGLLAFWLYLAAVLYNTVNFFRILHGHFAVGSHYNLTPFAEIREIAASPDRVYAVLNIGGNVVMFAPFGFLTPLLWKRWRGMRVFIVSLLFSCGIETLQLFTGRGTDIDDVILNTLGGMCGYAGFRLAKSAFPGLVRRFRLRTRGDSEHPNGPEPHRSRERRRPYGGTALRVTAAGLCVLVSGVILLGGYLQSSAGADSSMTRLEGPALEMPDLSSETVLLLAGDRILYEKNGDRRIYPASMTKIMTAVLVLEHTGDLQQPVVLREEIFSRIHSANLSTAGFLPHETVEMEDLLYGLLLPSGAECAVGLAEHIAGSEEAFAALMNAKAGELGMGGTHFTNATGAHDRGHYTTASDLAILMQYALDNPMFRTIASSERHGAAPTNLHPEGITLHSTWLGAAADIPIPAGEILGGKTGYTDKAGQCLASFARVGGEELILITAGARPEDFRRQQLHIDDALAVYSALS